MNLKGRVVMISGGGTGIGKATALSFARHGAHVIICGRRSEVITETASIVQKNSGKATAMPVDVNNRSQIKEVVKKVLDQFGRIDVLVNSAGTAIMKPVASTTVEEWDAVMNTNLRGTFLFCSAVLPSMMEARRGVIVNMSSILGKAGIANMAAYCSSKFGVIGLTQSLAEETKAYGINIFAVCPGPTDTPLHGNLVGKENAQRAMSPSSVAKTIIDLVTARIDLPSGGDLVIDENTSIKVIKKPLRYIKRARSLISGIKRALLK